MDGEENLTERKKKRFNWWKSHGKKNAKNEELHVKPAVTSEKKKKEEKKQHKSEDQVNPEVKKDCKDDGGKRYILFVGNLPFSVKEEDIKTHFRCAGNVKEFRLMTKTSGESKGCGFLEFEKQDSFWKALNLHHSMLRGRKINVEVTCGGGGSGEERRNKLKRKKQRLKKARQALIKSKVTDETKDDNKPENMADTVQEQKTKCSNGNEGNSAPDKEVDTQTLQSSAEHQETIKEKKKRDKKRKIKQKCEEDLGHKRKKAKT